MRHVLVPFLSTVLYPFSPSGDGTHSDGTCTRFGLVSVQHGAWQRASKWHASMRCTLGKYPLEATSYSTSAPGQVCTARDDITRYHEMGHARLSRRDESTGVRPPSPKSLVPALLAGGAGHWPTAEGSQRGHGSLAARDHRGRGVSSWILPLESCRTCARCAMRVRLCWAIRLASDSFGRGVGK